MEKLKKKNDISFYTFYTNNSAILNHTLTYFETNIVNHDAKGLDCIVNYDISQSSFQITYDSSLCTIDISDNTYTFSIISYF